MGINPTCLSDILLKVTLQQTLQSLAVTGLVQRPLLSVLKSRNIVF